MSRGPRGQRDSQTDSWKWTSDGEEQPPQPPRPSQRPRPGRRPPWLPILAMIVGLGLLGVALAMLLLTGDDDENSGAGARPTASGALTATARETSEPTEEATRTATAASAPDITLRLVAWSRRESRWYADSLSAEADTYREGEAVPFLLRLEEATGDESYEVQIRYQCGTDIAAAFDYLAQPAEADAPSAVTDPGPARARSDSSIPIPDDPGITFDDGEGHRLWLWGGAFQAAPQAPSPSGTCTDAKEVTLDLVARAETVFLMWAGHLASAADWGAGRGASSQQAPIFSEVSVNGGEPARVEVPPEAVAP